MAFLLTGSPINLSQLEEILDKRLMLEIPADILSGFTTENVTVNPEQATVAQDYLKVHAVGFGPEIPEEIIRLALIIYLQTYINRNKPDIRQATLNRLLAFYNRDIFPVVLQQGTSASQLTQLILPLMGIGKVKYQGYELNAADILDIFSWQPLMLHPAEVTTLLQAQTFSLAQLSYNLLQLNKFIPWTIYLANVFTQIASANPEDVTEKTTLLQNIFELTQNAFEKNQLDNHETNGPESLINNLSSLIKQLQSCLGVLANYTAETYENLISTSEPPATVSFAQALGLNKLLHYQLDQISVNSAATPDSFIQLQTLNASLVSLIGLTEQITALAFWSVSQVGKVFNLAAENLTLAAYYHSELFVSKEMVITQLEKTITFIRTHSPTVQD